MSLSWRILRRAGPCRGAEKVPGTEKSRSLYEHPAAALGELQLFVLGEFPAPAASAGRVAAHILAVNQARLHATSELHRLCDEVRGFGKDLEAARASLRPGSGPDERAMSDAGGCARRLYRHGPGVLPYRWLSQTVLPGFVIAPGRALGRAAGGSHHQKTRKRYDKPDREES